LEPQSTAFFLLLIVIFGALMWWLVAAKQVVLRALAACLAFVPAMLFGVAAVKRPRAGRGCGSAPFTAPRSTGRWRRRTGTRCT
jgi:hypothetical protein